MKIIEQLYSKDYSGLLKRPSGSRQQIEDIAARIIKRVEEGGDVALRAISQEIDGRSPGKLEFSREELNAAASAISPELKEAIDVAIKNIETFHRAQLPKPIHVETMPGVKCSVRYQPIPRIGLYIPGGSAPLFSTVLMTAVPATLAGCSEIIACTPPGASPEILYALSLFNIRVFALGGAQAIAAMGFGTESVPKVDKIFGPGNAYVTSAKMQMAGRGIAIDMPAGPSEVMVIADDTAVPAFVASDLLSQAEHGPDSQVILLATSMEIIDNTMAEIRKQLELLPRKITAARSLHESIAICVKNMDQAIEISNFYGPEHLILAVADYQQVAESINNAGSVFLGNYSPETAGDYASGTNHTLPTYGFTRAWSGITINAFMKSITFQEIDQKGLEKLAPTLIQLARAEKLEAHASAVLQRVGDIDLS
jgi:histidinol dehydrogenase